MIKTADDIHTGDVFRFKDLAYVSLGAHVLEDREGMAIFCADLRDYDTRQFTKTVALFLPRKYPLHFVGSREHVIERVDLTDEEAREFYGE